MKKIKEEKGITLVALIITIVVLLILAAVAIGTVKNSDIIGYANQAKTLFEEKQKEEEEKIKEFEEQLKGEQVSFYGPKTDGTWLIKTSERIIIVLNQGISTHDYKGYTIEEVINLMPESERESAIAAANDVKDIYGEINQVIVATQMDNEWGENWELIVNGVKTFVFGLIVDNNTKLLLADPHSDEVKITEVITISDNLPEDVKKLVYKKSENYDVYALENIPLIKGVDDADGVILIDSENQMFGWHFYSEEMGGSIGEFATISLQPNDTIINVNLNGENKTIDTTFYKVEVSNGYIFYLDSNKEKLYKESAGISMGAVEEGKTIIEIEKSNYNIRNVGYIIQ